jgi:hypothetical protein
MVLLLRREDDFPHGFLLHVGISLPQKTASKIALKNAVSALFPEGADESLL